MKAKYIIILSLVICCFIAGCVEKSNADSGRFTEIYREDIGSLNNIIVIHDNVNNVTIYESSVNGGHAISVIPDWQLKNANAIESTE